MAITGEVGQVIARLMTGIDLLKVIGIAFECHDRRAEDGLQTLVEIEILRGDGLLYPCMVLAKQCLEGFVAQQDTVAVIAASVVLGWEELILEYFVEVHGIEHGERPEMDGEQVGVSGTVGLKDGNEIEPCLSVAGNLLH